MGHLVGEPRHRDLGRAADPAAGNRDQAPVDPGRPVPVRVAIHPRTRRRRVPGERHLLVAHRRHEPGRRGRCSRLRQDGHRQARGRLDELVAGVKRAVVRGGQHRLGRQVHVHGHRRRRPGRAGHGDRRAVHLARRNAQHGHAARERPVPHRHRNVDRERRPREQGMSSPSAPRSRPTSVRRCSRRTSPGTRAPPGRPRSPPRNRPPPRGRRRWLRALPAYGRRCRASASPTTRPRRPRPRCSPRGARRCGAPRWRGIRHLQDGQFDAAQDVSVRTRAGGEPLGAIASGVTANADAVKIRGLIEIAQQRLGLLRLGRGGQEERAHKREARRGGQRTGGAEEPAPRAGDACQGRRPTGGGYGLRWGTAAPAGRQMVRRRWRAVLLPRPRRRHGLRLGARRSALGARRSALLILTPTPVQQASSHLTRFDSIAVSLPIRAQTSAASDDCEHNRF